MAYGGREDEQTAITNRSKPSLQFKRKSQARALPFLVLFLFLVPTVLAIGYTEPITGLSALSSQPEPSIPLTGSLAVVDPQPTAVLSEEASEIPESVQDAIPEPPQEQPTETPQTSEEVPHPEIPQELTGQPSEEPTEEPITEEPIEETPQEEPTEPINLCEGVECVPMTEICPDDYEAKCAPVCNPESGGCDPCSPDCSGHDFVIEPEQNQTDLCENILCDPFNLICTDGFEAICENFCIPETGDCSICEPDCTGHDLLANETNQTEPECEESWNCTAWTACFEGIKSRECIDDNGCGTETGIPELEIPCDSIPECNITCSDCEILDSENCTCIPDNNCEIPPEPDTCTIDDECNATGICTIGSCINSTCQYQTSVPCCGNNICEDEESYENCNADCDEPDVPAEPFFSISVEGPDRMKRGTTQDFTATIRNIGDGAASYIEPYWMLPDGLQLMTTYDNCGSLQPGESCTVNARIYVEPDVIGLKEIRILVDYA